MDGWMLGIHPRICIWEHVIDLVIFPCYMSSFAQYVYAVVPRYRSG